jgi:putative peptidoglycan lipid II flippase
VAAENAARRPQGVFRNTAIFAVATGLSRIMGLVREIAAARYYGTGAAAAAFTVAFQVPNLIRALVADAALSSAFVPEFTRLMEDGKQKEARELAGALVGIIVVGLGLITLVFMVAAPLLMPVFTGSKFTHADNVLTAGLSRVLFPIVVLLALNGLVVGILNAHDHFSIPAIAPLVWNVVIIAGLIGFRGLFDGPHKIYAYAIGVLIGTVVQFAMCIPPLRRMGIHLRPSLHWRAPGVTRVLQLMLPVSLGLGVINVDLIINTFLGSSVSAGAPRAIDAAFRIYMLPQGMFSVAVATVLFPQLSRLAARRDLPGLRRWSGGGMRLIFLALIPCAAAMVVLSEPLTRLVFERGAFGAQSTHDTALALFWFSFSLPFNGANLMLTRTFFSLQLPWMPTKLAGLSLVVNAVVSLALYKPFGIAGVVIGTAVSNMVMTAQQIYFLRRELGGFEIAGTIRSVATMTGAAVAFGVVAYFSWHLLDDALGRDLLAQIVSVGVALTAGFLVYGGLVLLAKLPEAEQVRRMVTRRSR